MGVIFPQIITINHNNRYNKYYFEKGYKIENNLFNINIEDLQQNSGQKIKCICDNCKKEIEKSRCKIKNIYNKTFCSKCAIYAAKDTCIKKYGYEFALCSPKIQKDIQNRNFKKYNVKSTFELESVKQKSKETLLKKYNVDNIAKLDSTIEKIKNTNKKKYGVEFPIQNEKIRKKIATSYFKKYNKQYNTSFIACSKNQKILANIFNGTINKDLNGIYGDIVLENKKIVIEYDGGGHDLCVKLKKISLEKFKEKEQKREQFILNQGYKIIRIISPKDYLLNQDLMKNVIENSLNMLQNNNIIRILIINKEDFKYV